MSEVSRAVEILRRGGLVAFPTETVYGLGADAGSSVAVRKIFQTKGRPATNPLIVHVADIATACRYARHWPPAAEALAAKFWPGPLTLVLPKASTIVDEATAGGETVGLRVPNHPLALDMLRAFASPVAAPSANRSNHISPTTADHVRQELGDQVDLILDGGACAVGIESTVLDLSQGQAKILRPGGASRAMIEAIIGPVLMFSGSIDLTTTATSPGMHQRHYSPGTPAYRFEAGQRGEILHQADERTAVVLCGPGTAPSPGPIIVELPAETAEYARRIYGTLRQLDQARHRAIFIEMPPATPPWAAVRDRLIRATQPA